MPLPHSGCSLFSQHTLNLSTVPRGVVQPTLGITDLRDGKIKSEKRVEYPRPTYDTWNNCLKKKEMAKLCGHEMCKYLFGIMQLNEISELNWIFIHTGINIYSSEHAYKLFAWIKQKYVTFMIPGNLTNYLIFKTRPNIVLIKLLKVIKTKWQTFCMRRK